MEGGEPRPPPIAPAPTSVTAFVGSATEGPLGEPVDCHAYADFEREFGGSSAATALGRAVQMFFANGGARAQVVRTGSDPAGVALERLPEVDFNLLNLVGAGLEDLAEAARFCSERGAMLIAEPGPAADAEAAVRFAGALLEAAGETAQNIALYYPRVRAARATAGPGGAVAGLIARVDAAQGVWGAPAGTSYPLADVDGLAHDLDGGELEDLSNQGVNCLRSFAGVGTVVWGARTLAGASSSDSEWKYVPVRRLALLVEESLERALQWTVFEPNGERLWKVVRQAVEDFLHGLWREGAFPGGRPQDAYFVRCDGSTMTQDDIRAGRLVVHVGIAPLRPAEFVVIRIGPFRCAG